MYVEFPELDLDFPTVPNITFPDGSLLQYTDPSMYSVTMRTDYWLALVEYVIEVEAAKKYYEHWMEVVKDLRREREAGKPD